MHSGFRRYRPLGFVLTPDQTHDTQGGAPLIADRIEAMLADKGYDAGATREEIAKAEVEAVIPATAATRPSMAKANTDGATRSTAFQQAQELAPDRHSM
ncbi:hypothetical protein MesoLjLc_52980 [Mesorhizobium sp. L-8-10]|uniref:transposase n=1 Tax=Mesorhizobium sp. L-8-10 TaxID=2744523 RepID=UPI0019263362|nr:transposase [Mesorhizobium sp. L-8-10]BCH33368.1 hypothetical protein MesoLjLc_52980 [Mesorhizobium sp. L-8-10]